MAATITTGTTTRARGGIPYKGLRHLALPMTAVANTNTLTSDAATASQKIPLGTQNVAWEPDTSTENVAVTVTTTATEGSEVCTILFNTSGATNYSGTLHIWTTG